MPRTDALKRPWCWEWLKAGEEGDDRGWDGWMASLTQWTWVWVSSRSWWWIGKPGVPQSMGLQRGGHDWATELNWCGDGLLSKAMSDSLTPWTVTHQAPVSIGLSRQEYWNGFPFPSPGDLPNPGIQPGSPVLQVVSNWATGPDLGDVVVL